MQIPTPVRPRNVPEAHAEIFDEVWRQLWQIPFVDMHTHLFAPAFGRLGLWGIDELLTYHYLEAEFFRASRVTPESYAALSKTARADAVWEELFVRRTPLSAAARDIVTILKTFDLPVTSPDLRQARAFFASRDFESHLRVVLNLAGISDIVMTNDPLDPHEAEVWGTHPEPSPGFHAALRLDRILTEWERHYGELRSQRYEVELDGGGRTASEVRRFLANWFTRMNPVYMAVSLPDTFTYPEQSIRVRLLSDAVLPSCEEFGVPLALMIGVRRQVNPALKLAGDGMGRANLISLENLCRDFPRNRFLVTVLSRENQHELCVHARKFSNLMPFGCWWFANQPSIVEEITRERIEMLGTTFIPQHSDARVLEQLIPKWESTRATMAPVFGAEFAKLHSAGRPVSEHDISRDIARYFRGNFAAFCGSPQRFSRTAEVQD